MVEINCCDGITYRTENCSLCIVCIVHTHKGNSAAFYKNVASFMTNLFNMIPGDLIESKEICGCCRWDDIIVFFLHLNET